MRYRSILWMAITLFALQADAASAQSGTRNVEVGIQGTFARSTEFDAGDAGVGGRLSWHPNGLLGVEGELSVFPRGFPSDRAFSRSRVEGLFGMTAGVDVGRVRPFARLRPGFLTVRASDEPVACILIFPPPLSCQLAGGRTLLALDIGGGVAVAITPRTSIRIDAGDRMLRYPGPAFRDGGTVREDSFFSHDFRLATGVGFGF